MFMGYDYHLGHTVLAMILGILVYVSLDRIIGITSDMLLYAAIVVAVGILLFSAVSLIAGKK
jgi:hypothetical protein